MANRFNSGQVADWGTNGGLFAGSFVEPGQWWHASPFYGAPAGSAWPIINRAYATRFFFHRPTTITAVGINVTVGGTASNVVRLGLYTNDNGTPGVILDQTTVAGDTTGQKTWTLTTPLAFSGLFWVAAAPQGSSTPGSTWMAAGSHLFHTGNSSASMNLTFFNPSTLYWNTSTTFADNPSVTWENDSRNPVFHLRLQS